MGPPPDGRSSEAGSRVLLHDPPAPEGSQTATNARVDRGGEEESDSDVTIVGPSGPRRVKMRRLKARPRPTVEETVKAHYLVVKRRRVDQEDDNRRQPRGNGAGRAGPLTVPGDTRVVRVVFWTAHNTRPKIVHARLSKNFVQLAAVPALMEFLQLPRDAQWDRWDEYQYTWTTNWTVHDNFWVSWATSTILGRVHQPDPEAHGRVGGVVGLPGFGHELTRLEMKTPGMVHDPTPVAVHILEDDA